MRDRLRDRDRGQGAERLAAAERDRDGADRRGHQPRSVCSRASPSSTPRTRIGKAIARSMIWARLTRTVSGKVPALRGGFIVLADDRASPARGTSIAGAGDDG